MLVTATSFIALASSAYLVKVLADTDVKLALVSSAFCTFNSAVNVVTFAEILRANALAFNNRFD